VENWKVIGSNIQGNSSNAKVWILWDLTLSWIILYEMGSNLCEPLEKIQIKVRWLLDINCHVCAIYKNTKNIHTINEQC